MIDFISYIPNQFEEGFNKEFITKSCDTPIETFVIIAMKELEVIENIKIEDIKIVYDMDEIDPNYHRHVINFKKKNLDKIVIPKGKPILQSMCGEAIFKVRIKTNKNEKVIEKRILFPVDEDGVYLNNGKKMRAIWQLVEASTYSQLGKITMKSRMPIIVYRNRNRVIHDINNIGYPMPSFSYALDGKQRKMGAKSGKKRTKFFDPLMLFLAKLGWAKTRNFWCMDGIVDILSGVDEPTEKELEEWIYFPLDYCYVRVLEYFYNKYDEVKAFTCMCCNLYSKEYPVRYEHLENKEYWVCRIGYVGSMKNSDIYSFRGKGKTTIYMIERLLDQVTINNLRMPDIYKNNVYYLIYTMIMNFDAFKSKKNMDMASKRVRCNEAIVNATLGRKINEIINKIIEKVGKSRENTIDTLLEAFNFDSAIIMNGMRNNSDMFKPDDIVNDLDILLSLAWTSKGPNSMGEKNSKSIPAKYRYLDPSMVGVLDLSLSSNNDIGLTGAFVPYVKTYDNFYFTPDPEPTQGRYLFEKSLSEEKYPNWEYMGIYDLTSYDAYVDSVRELDPYRDGLQYEKICIVEKDDNKTEKKGDKNNEN